MTRRLETAARAVIAMGAAWALYLTVTLPAIGA